MLSNSCILFIGGISTSVLETDIKEYFNTYCDILDCIIIIDKTTKQSCGFGFIIIKSQSKAKKILSSQQHIIRGRVIECRKVSLSNKHYISKRKRFVSGIPPNTDENALKVFYQKYKEVEYTIIMTDRATDKHKGIGFVVFKDDESVDMCMSDVKHGKQIESKISNIKSNINNNNINGCNSLHKYNYNNSNDNLRETKDLNSNNKLCAFNYFLPNLSQVKNFNSNHLQNEKDSYLYTSNYYVNPAYVDNINKNDKTFKLKYSFRHLERNQYNLNSIEESKYGLTNLFCYQQESECININNTINVDNYSTSFIKEPSSHHYHHQLNFFENYFNNYLEDPKLNAHNKFRLFDINGEDASKLSTYQNKTKIKLFNTESNDISDKDSNNLNHNLSYSPSSDNNNVNSVQGNITSNSVISDSIITINSDYKDSDKEQKPNDSNAYYGPRIHKTSKMFPYMCSFRPY